MITRRPSQERGYVDAGWLQSQHTFSFGNYMDPKHMGFASLRVINEDHVAPGKGFAKHGHKDMEIVTYVLDGVLTHQDSIGNGSMIRPGDVQRMSAGTGIQHSEHNGDDAGSVHLLQIWILPDRNGIAPGYEQKTFATEEKRGKLCLLGSSTGRDGSITIRQNVDMYAAILQDGESVTHRLSSDRVAWLQVVRGALQVNGQDLTAGDGAAIEQESQITLQGSAQETELLLFDMAAI